jgi:hypothetical protein
MEDSINNFESRLARFLKITPGYYREFRDELLEICRSADAAIETIWDHDAIEFRDILMDIESTRALRLLEDLQRLYKSLPRDVYELLIDQRQPS